MGQRILAVYENGVFRPLKPLDLPEGTILNIEIIGILEDRVDYMKYIEKDLAELEESDTQTSRKED